MKCIAESYYTTAGNAELNMQSVGCFMLVLHKGADVNFHIVL